VWPVVSLSFVDFFSDRTVLLASWHGGDRLAFRVFPRLVQDQRSVPRDIKSLVEPIKVQ
jgi:hypothetical protein